MRWLLVAVALLFLGAFVLVPRGGRASGGAPRTGSGSGGRRSPSADARAAIRLTLLVAAIAVPLNALFGLAAAWSITRFRYPGKNVLVSLIDLPFGVSPVISGMVHGPALRRARLARALAPRARR